MIFNLVCRQRSLKAAIRTHCAIKRRFVVFLAMWTLFVVPVASATEIDGNLVRVASEWKSKAEQWAHILKKDHKSTSPTYRQAIKLYIDAKASADAWVSQMLMDLRNNATAPSHQYQKKLLEVSERASAFVEYAEGVYFESKGSWGSSGKLLTQLTEAGVTIYKTYHEVNMEKKKNIEKAIEALTWKTFDEA